MVIGNTEFDIQNQFYIMGILNTTPDSFYDGGTYINTDIALRRCKEMINEGASIIDVGGQSTKPGYTEISTDEEISRVCKVVSKIKENFNIPVSVDTYNHHVAHASISAGADMINDISGLKKDTGGMAKVIADADVPCCIVHNRIDYTHKELNHNNTTINLYNSFIDDIISDLSESINIALNNGIKKNNIIIDPGIGFAKNYSQNLETIKNLDTIKATLKLPMLLGASNKSFIGKALDLCDNDIKGRLEGTLATTAFGIMEGVSFFRVHNVAENRKVIDLLKAIIDKGNNKS